MFKTKRFIISTILSTILSTVLVLATAAYAWSTPVLQQKWFSFYPQSEGWTSMTICDPDYLQIAPASGCVVLNSDHTWVFTSGVPSN